MKREQGQATVELALLLPFLVGLVLTVVQVGLVLRDRVALTHVTRVAARAAAVDPSEANVLRAAGGAGLDARRVSVRVARRGRLVSVEVKYRSPTDVPMVGVVVGDVALSERLVAFVEECPSGYGQYVLFASATNRNHGWVVLSITGDCDLASAPTMRRELLAASEGAERLAVDLRGVSFIDSVGLGLLIGVARKVGELVLVAGIDDPARRVLETSRVDRILDVRGELPQA